MQYILTEAEYQYLKGNNPDIKHDTNIYTKKIIKILSAILYSGYTSEDSLNLYVGFTRALLGTADLENVLSYWEQLVKE